MPLSVIFYRFLLSAQPARRLFVFLQRQQQHNERAGLRTDERHIRVNGSQATVSGLSPFTRYEVTVAAVSDETGVGRESEPLAFRTEEAGTVACGYYEI